MPGNSDEIGISEQDALDFPEAERSRELIERAKRLRMAVDGAGRNKAVALRAGVPVGTLNNYLKGRDMKASVMIALADACRVSLEWLATGAGDRNPLHHVSGPAVGTAISGGGEVVQGPMQPLNAPREDSRRVMFTEENVIELTEALDQAEQLIEERGSDPETRGRVQLMLILRDHIYRGRHGKG